MIPCLAELPPEIYSAILIQVPTEERQQVVLALSRAIPRSPVPLHHLFECICLRTAESVFHLYRRVCGCAEEVRWVKSFSLETWTVDADIVVNLLAILPHLSKITLFIGSNFAPEHLEEILTRPREDLRHLSLRFRPYVQKATYYQFLKGAYFDTSLHALSRWPAYNLHALSIVQDPLDPEIARMQHFAQPLVFFRLNSITTLICSPTFRTLPSLRLQIPSRQVAPFIFNSPGAAPALSMLDLSTCSIRPSDVETLVARFRNLRHLILDDCTIVRGESHEGEWIALGKMCALATVKAAKDREKKLKDWLETNAARIQARNEGTHQQTLSEPHGRRIRPGRRGLATATISLRESPPTETAPTVRRNTNVPRIRVVPASPTICSLSTTFNTHLRDERTVQAEFSQGWAEGLAQLNAVRKRMYQSWKNGVRVMHIMGGLDTEDGFMGLEDVGETAFVNVGGEHSFWPTPVLCLAGSNPGALHVDGCGHPDF